MNTNATGQLPSLSLSRAKHSSDDKFRVSICSMALTAAKYFRQLSCPWRVSFSCSFHNNPSFLSQISLGFFLCISLTFTRKPWPCFLLNSCPASPFCCKAFMYFRTTDPGVSEITLTFGCRHAASITNKNKTITKLKNELSFNAKPSSFFRFF